MKKPKKEVCAYCADQGWDKWWADRKFGITAYSPLWARTKKDVYRCPYCEKPENAPPMPKGNLFR